MKDYETTVIREALKHIEQIERSPLADRQAGFNELYMHMAGSADLVAERIEWLLNGSYGYGEMKLALRHVDAHANNKRYNRNAGLMQLIGQLEWMTSAAYVRKAYNQLTDAQKDGLNNAIDAAVVNAYKED